jgi:hypothetical protein
MEKEVRKAMSKFLVTVIEKVRVLYEVEAETEIEIYEGFPQIVHHGKELSSVFDGSEIESIREDQ